jgi:hypothetical protein
VAGGQNAMSSLKVCKAPSFGANQVIIVREQRVKEELPEFMKSMLCLTVYESKGLEFDDVILFNFFTMGEIRHEMWKLLYKMKSKESPRHPPHFLLDWSETELEHRLAEADQQICDEYKSEDLGKNRELAQEKKDRRAEA